MTVKINTFRFNLKFKPAAEKIVMRLTYEKKKIQCVNTI